MKKKRIQTPEELEAVRTKDFFDCILPGVLKFQADHYVRGDWYCCAWAIREYSPSTEEQAILSQVADRSGVTLRIYCRLVTGDEQRKILQNAARRNNMMRGGSDVTEAVEAEGNLEDVVNLLANLRKNKEPLLHTAVYLELCATSLDKLKALQSDIQIELARAKLSVDRLTLRQKEGFLSVHPTGSNWFGVQFERVLPASSVANLYPLNYSGKLDPNGFYIGKDKFGTHILADLDRRAGDKTNANVLILGNSGQGKSYLMKLLLTNLRESGKRILLLDAEKEYGDLTKALGGSYVDFLSGGCRINPLEPKVWTDGAEEGDETVPETFRKNTRLSQHVAFLKDFFRVYKDFTDAQIDTLEILLLKLYRRFDISDESQFDRLPPERFPILSDLYALAEEEYKSYDGTRKNLYTEETLQAVCLGLHSMCVGAESRFFNGHTNLADDRFLCFDVKDLTETNRRLKDAALFNLLSYLSGVLLGRGNAVAGIDELYLFLSNLTAIAYIRNMVKRNRKKDSAMILASQNIEDFLIPSVRAYTKPLFSIPTHQFLFHPGSVNPREYMDALQLEESEYERIRYPERGTCIFRCGSERYLLQVKAPDYKEALFGEAGGR